MKKIFSKLTVVSALLAGIYSAPSLAVGWPVFDTASNTNQQLLQQIIVSNFTKEYTLAQTQYNTLLELSQYLHGTTTGGNGLVEGITSMNEKLGQVVSKGNQDWSMNNALERKRMADQMQVEDKKARMPDSESCSEVTFANSRGAAAAATTVIGKALDINQSERIRAAKPESNQQILARLGRADKGYCQTADSANGTDNCSGVGDLAGADVMVNSIFHGAAGEKQQSNRSFDKNQVQAAKDFVNNIVGIVPAKLTKAQENTQPGQSYQSMKNVFDSRVSVAVTPFNDIIGRSTVSTGIKQGDALGTWVGDAKQAWPNNETLWKKVFPGEPFPTEAPSEWDLLRFDVFSRYADASDENSWQAKVSAFDEKSSLHEMARMMALQLRLNVLGLEYQEKTNTLLSTLLVQQLSPVNTEQMEALRQRAVGGNNK